MAARNYGSTGKQQPYCRLNDQPAERLEQLAQDFGTARDGLQLRDAVQQLMRELCEQIQLFNRECMTLERMANWTDLTQRRAATIFRGNVNESISKFQRLSKDVERLERDNPLQNSDPFGNMDDYIQYSGTSARQSTYQQGKILSLEQNRRLVEQRNRALNELQLDIQDLNSIVRDMAEEVYGQEDRINKIDLIEDNPAAENVNSPLVLRKTVRHQRNRKLKIVIAVIIPVIIIVIILVILTAILGLCIGTSVCNSIK